MQTWRRNALALAVFLALLVIITTPVFAGVPEGGGGSLLHFNGNDGSTTFHDEALNIDWIANGNAQIDTAQSVFGGASGLFDGTGDYLSSADHADWQLDGGSDSNEW